MDDYFVVDVDFDFCVGVVDCVVIVDVVDVVGAVVVDSADVVDVVVGASGVVEGVGESGCC